MAQDTYTFQDIPTDGLKNAVSTIAIYLQFLSRLASQEKAFITGLVLEWVSGTSLKVNTGAAYVQTVGLQTVSAAITKSSLSLSSSSWYHVYLYKNTGTGLADIEISTTAPVLYFGTAYQKTGDSSRRYLGSVRTDGSGNIYNFIHRGEEIMYRVASNASPFRVLSNGTATTETTVSCASVVPVTARIFEANVNNATTSGNGVLGSSDDGITGGASVYAHIIIVSGGRGYYNLRHHLDSSQQCAYWYDGTPSGGGLYIDVLGYWFDR